MTVYNLHSRNAPYTLAVPDGDHLDRVIARRKVPYELPAMRAIAALIPKDGVVVDVGANVGNHTVFWAMHGFFVHAFEPHQAALSWLYRNIEDNKLAGRVAVYPVAIGGQEGRVSLNVKDMHLGATSITVDEQGSVQMVALDSHLFEKIDALKIDVEGHEAAVISGAGATLARHRPVIMAEAWSSAQGADRHGSRGQGSAGR
jgi:FkbM family methyltransferase